MDSCFVPLHSQSDGSFLRGCVSPREWAREAARLGHRALALADVESLAHAVEFHEAARAEGLKPVLGLEFDRADASALVLARDATGYERLCRLASLAALDPAFRLCEVLRDGAAGLYVASDDPATLRALEPLSTGLVYTRLRAGRSAPAHAARAAALARELGRPLLATGEALFLAPPQREVRRALEAARRRTLAARVTLERAAPAHGRLLAPDGAAREFEAFPEALRANAEVAASCELRLRLGTPVFPEAPVPGGGDALEYLRARSEEGLLSRYAPPRRPAARARLRHELAQIQAMGFTPYFLLVADIVAFTRRSGIPCLGRGSGASSIVAYCLGITNVDPIAHRLCFERFLHPARPDCPDLDIDLCWIRREEVIEHVQRTYGADRTAVIATHARFGFRSAFREVAKALGVGPEEVDRLAARLPRELNVGPDGDVAAALRAHPPAARTDWSEPVLGRSLRASTWLEGHLHHLGMHPGGMVIADRPLTHYLALARSPRGPIITQCEMRAVEALGLVKMDLLGNRAVTEIGDTLAALPPPLRAAAADPPDADPATLGLLKAGATLSCFQLESPAMRHLLQQLAPEGLADTIAAVALIRPGAAGSGMKERFLRRRLGLEPAEDFHPLLRDVLRETHGLLVYEEDVIAVAARMLGESAAEGDLVRRAIGSARDPAQREALGATFVDRCARRGLDRARAGAVWVALERFAAYAFCRAHAAGYGVLAYQTAWLKAHHAAEFYCAVLNHHQGMYPRWVHIEEARRLGVRVCGPCVNRSGEAFTLEPPQAGAPSRAIRAGLSCVALLTAGSRARVLGGRAAGGAYDTLADFVARTRLAERECAALVDAGAFDWTGHTRPSLLFELAAAHAAYRHAAPAGMFRGRGAPCALPEISEFALGPRLQREFEAAGFTVSAPPLAPHAAALRALRPSDAAALPRCIGRLVCVAGLPCAMRRVRTRNGEPMLFLTLADGAGLVECTFFPDAYRASPPPVDSGPLVVEGRVEEQLGAVTVTARRWWKLGADGTRAVA